MLNEVPKLFGKGFVLGYILPALLFVLYVCFVGQLNPVNSQIQNPAKMTLDLAGRLFAAALLISFILLLINSTLVRIIEGYGRFNPFRLLKFFALKGFHKHGKPVFDDYAELEAAWARGERRPVANDFERKLRKASFAYPADERFVLPTKFGNTYRAFEAYPLIIYGIDTVTLWPRIMCVIPDGAKDQLQDARSVLDFHVCIFWLSILAALITAVGNPGWHGAILAIPAIVTAFVAWFILPSVVRRWGLGIASVFDLYRTQLAESLGLKLPDDPTEEREMWAEVTSMMLIRSAQNADRLKPYRLKNEDGASEFRRIIGDFYWRKPEE